MSNRSKMHLIKTSCGSRENFFDKSSCMVYSQLHNVIWFTSRDEMSAAMATQSA